VIKVNIKYESVQKEIDKLFEETSKKRTHKKYQEMKIYEEYNSAVKKIGKLMMQLEKLEEDRKNGKRNRKTTT
jgi:hypothetical protein